MNLHVLYISSSQTLISMLSVKNIIHTCCKNTIFYNYSTKSWFYCSKQNLRVVFHGLYFHSHRSQLKSLCFNQFKPIFVPRRNAGHRNAGRPSVHVSVRQKYALFPFEMYLTEKKMLRRPFWEHTYGQLLYINLNIIIECFYFFFM